MVPSNTPSNTPAVVSETERGVFADMDYELGNLQTTEDFLAFFKAQGIEVTDITDFGDGFKGVDKSELVNLPMVIVDYTVSMNGKYKNDNGEVMPFVIVRAIAAGKGKVRFTDGSSGVAAQTLDLYRRKVLAGIQVKGGLTVSEYEVIGKNEKGEETRTPARTYYYAM